MRKGITAAVITYILWGLLPIYWKWIQKVPALEILCHRTLWSFVFVVMILTAKRHWSWLQRATKSRRTLVIFGTSACLLTLNWFTYIWSVTSGHIVDASLGYFINPLVSVLLGVVFLKERLRRWQTVAIAIATFGVVFLTLAYGSFPWIALVLAITFGVYGLLRKTAPLDSLEGLTLETAILSLPALGYLVYLDLQGTASFGHAGVATSILLALAGVVTALPLLLFAYAARRVTLATLGILQYIAPTLQFLLGVLVYQETFTQIRLVGFAAIWIALLIYSLEGMTEERKRRAARYSSATGGI